MANPLAIEFGPTPQMQMAELANVQQSTALKQQQVEEAKNNQVLQKQQAQKQQMELVQQQKRMQIFADLAGRQGVSKDQLAAAQDPYARDMLVSNMALASGDIEMADTYAQSAAKWQKEQADLRVRQLDGMKKQTDMIHQMDAHIAALIGSATDDASLQRMNTYIAATTGQPSPLAGKSFKEAAPIIKQMVEQSKTVAEQAKDKLAIASERSKEQFRQDTERHRKVLEAQNTKRLEMMGQRETRMAKAEGKISGNLPEHTVDAETARIMQDNPELKDNPVEAQLKSRAIVSTAVKIMKASGGATDLEHALILARGKVSMKPGVTVQDGSSPALALPVSNAGDIKGDGFYRSASGQIYQVKGGKATPVEFDPTAGLNLEEDNTPDPETDEATDSGGE